MATQANEPAPQYFPMRGALTWLPQRYPLPWAWGMVSLTLGFISLVLAVLPVLGIPISSCALASGVIGLAVAWPRGGVLLRWTLMGVVLSGASLGMNIALWNAVAGYVPDRGVGLPWNPPSGRPYISPPSGVFTDSE